MMRGRCSERQHRAAFAGCLPIDVSQSAWAKARRLARGCFRKKRGALGVRARQALNVCGVRIWADKPRLFGGREWKAACATVQRSIERRERRDTSDYWAAIGVPF